MTPDQLEKYRKKLIALDGRIAEELVDISDELTTGGVPVGEHDDCVSDGLDADIAIEKVEERMQQDVRAALKRIKAGSFGICEDCDGKIIKARLDAIPYTPVCIKCETTREAA